MKNLPELKPTKYDFLLAVVLLALAVGLAVRLWAAPQQSGTLTAVVCIDGAETDRFPVGSGAVEPRSYTNRGITLTLTGGEGGEGICVAASDCPSQSCVHTGTISKPGQSIVCLPARIVISLEGAQADYDLIAG